MKEDSFSCSLMLYVKGISFVDKLSGLISRVAQKGSNSLGWR